MTIISLSGCDGSGKTTTAHNLMSLFQSMGIDVQYREEFRYFILRYILKIFNNRIKKERKKFLERKEIKPYYKLWPIMVWIDSNIEMIYMKAMHFNKTFILDRFLMDHLISFEYLGYINSKIKNLLFKLSLKPDIMIVLDASPDVMYKRKKKTHTYPFDFYREQRQRYLITARNFNIPVVRTDQDNEAVLKNILFLIAKKLSRAEDLVLHILSDPLIDNKYINILNNIINWKEININYIILEASRQNVEYPTYERLKRYINNDKNINYFIKIIKNKYTNYIDVISKIVNILEKNNIEYVIFKTIPPFKHLPRDIDLLVREDEKEKVIKILRDNNFIVTKKHKIHKEISLEKSGIEIDLHWRIEWMGQRVIDEYSMLKKYRIISLENVNNIRVPDPLYELILVLAHSILQHHYITLSELHYIRSLVYNFNIDLNTIINYIEKYVKNKCINKYIKKVFYILYIKEKIYYNNMFESKINLSKKYKIKLNDVIRPVIWYGPCGTSSFLELIDSILYIYRKIKYILTRRLPYNEPLTEIANLTL